MPSTAQVEAIDKHKLPCQPSHSDPAALNPSAIDRGATEGCATAAKLDPGQGFIQHCSRREAWTSAMPSPQPVRRGPHGSNTTMWRREAAGHLGHYCLPEPGMTAASRWAVGRAILCSFKSFVRRRAKKQVPQQIVRLVQQMRCITVIRDVYSVVLEYSHNRTEHSGGHAMSVDKTQHA